MAERLPGQSKVSRWGDVSPRTKNFVAFALLFLVTIPMLTKNFTSDFGTHIAIGREIVKTLHVADREFLNYPSVGMYNPNGEWGFQTLLYLVFAAGGEYGVSFLCWAVVFGIYLLLHRSMTLRGANPFLAVFAIFAFSGFLRIRIQPRPEIFTYLFIALTMYLLSEYYFGKRKKLIFLFPPMILIWANMHPTYLMAFLLCGAFFADGLARAAWRKELRWGNVKGWIFPPVVVGVLGLVLCGLNPHGYDAILTPLHLISRGGSGGGGGGGGSSSMLVFISELTPVKGTGLLVYYKAAAWFAAVSFLLGALGRRIYLLDLFLFSIAFKGAWDSARAVSMMGLFLSPGASLHLTGFFTRVEEWLALDRSLKRKDAAKDKASGKKRGKKEQEGRPIPQESTRSRMRPAHIAVTALIVLALSVFGTVTLSFSFSQLEYGIGLTRHKFSFAAAEFLRKNPIGGKMFNFFDIGGFLDWQIYPQALTFIDGRTYNHEVFMDHQTVTGAQEGWEDIVRKYGIDYFVLKSMDSSGMILPIIPALASSPDWSLVFADGLFVIFVRNSPEDREYIAKHALSKKILPRHIIAESYHYMYLGISPIVAYQNITNMHALLGDRQAAIDALREALSVREEPFLRNRLMQLELGGGIGKPPEAGTGK